MHPGARRRGRGRQVVVEQVEQRAVVHHPLPEDHLGGRVRPVDGLERGLQLDDAASLFLLGGERGVVEGARLGQVGREPARERPRRVLHEEAELVLRRRRGHGRQIDLLEGRPRHRGHDLGLAARAAWRRPSPTSPPGRRRGRARPGPPTPRRRGSR